MEKIETRQSLDMLDPYVFETSVMRLGPLRVAKGRYPASRMAQRQVTAPTLSFILGKTRASTHIHLDGAQPTELTGQFGLVHFIRKGTRAASHWNDTIDAMTVTFDTETLEFCGRQFSLDSIPRSTLFFDPVACAVATDIAHDPGSGMQSALDYLLHRVLREVESRKTKESDCIRRAEQIARDITRNLPNLYVNGRFVYDDAFAEQGLRRAFLDRFGCTPHAFALRAKVDSAKLLLRETDLGLADIAGALGFSDQSHFARVFKDATAMTPRAFRIRPIRLPS